MSTRGEVDVQSGEAKLAVILNDTSVMTQRDDIVNRLPPHEQQKLQRFEDRLMAEGKLLINPLNPQTGIVGPSDSLSQIANSLRGGLDNPLKAEAFLQSRRGQVAQAALTKEVAKREGQAEVQEMVAEQQARRRRFFRNYAIYLLMLRHQASRAQANIANEMTRRRIASANREEVSLFSQPDFDLLNDLDEQLNQISIDLEQAYTDIAHAESRIASHQRRLKRRTDEAKDLSDMRDKLGKMSIDEIKAALHNSLSTISTTSNEQRDGQLKGDAASDANSTILIHSLMILEYKEELRTKQKVELQKIQTNLQTILGKDSGIEAYLSGQKELMLTTGQQGIMVEQLEKLRDMGLIGDGAGSPSIDEIKDLVANEPLLAATYIHDASAERVYLQKDQQGKWVNSEDEARKRGVEAHQIGTHAILVGPGKKVHIENGVVYLLPKNKEFTDLTETEKNRYEKDAKLNLRAEGGGDYLQRIEQYKRANESGIERETNHITDTKAKVKVLREEQEALTQQHNEHTNRMANNVPVEISTLKPAPTRTSRPAAEQATVDTFVRDLENYINSNSVELTSKPQARAKFNLYALTRPEVRNRQVLEDHLNSDEFQETLKSGGCNVEQLRTVVKAALSVPGTHATIQAGVAREDHAHNKGSDRMASSGDEPSGNSPTPLNTRPTGG